MYHIPRFSTAFSVKLIHFSAKINNILRPLTFPFHTITETPDFCVKVYFCLIVRFFPQSPPFQRHLKTQKAGSTNHSSEPHQALKTLILSHSSILLPVSTQIPMALFLNSRLCRCYTLMTFTPGVSDLPLFTLFTPPNSTFDKRDSTNCSFPLKPMLFSTAQSHQSSLKSCTSSCDSSASDAVCLVSNCEKRLSR